MVPIALSLFLAVTSAVTTRSASLLKPGARLRVWVGSDSTIGTLGRTEGDRIYLVEGDEQGWDLTSVDRIEVSTGRKGHALLGGFIGLVAGYGFARLAADAVSESEQTGQPLDDLDTIDEVVLTGAAVWAGTILVGALIGHSLKSDRWESGYVNPALSASPRGLAPYVLSLRIRF